MHDLQSHFASQLATLNGFVHKKLYYAIPRHDGFQVNYVWSDKLETLATTLNGMEYQGVTESGFPKYADVQKVTSDHA